MKPTVFCNTYPGVAYIVLKCLRAIVLWGGVVVGHLYADTSTAQRVWCAATATTLISTFSLTDEIGFAMAGVLLVWMWLRARQTAPIAGLL